MPEPVVSPQIVVGLTNRYPIDDVLVRFHAESDEARQGLSRREWRDLIVGVYMAAADARYQEFRINLSRESRGSNFGLDLGILGLSNLGTVSGQATANALAAATAGLTGARASLQREVYFQQTLPALAAGMEAARLEVATRIRTNLMKTAEEYPLQQAFVDILAYERAASLDTAIQRVTVQAAADQARQQANYDTIQHVAAIIPPGSIDLASKVADNITRLMNQNKADDIANILRTLNIPARGTLQDQTIDAIREVGRRASQGTLQQFVTDVRTQHGLELGQ